MTMILDGTNGAFLPTWTTATRPASPANGEIGYNSTTGQLDQYVSGAWSSVPTAGASQATATALGTVYAKQTTGGGTPYLTAFGYNAGVSTTGANNTAIGTQALFTNSTGTSSTALGYQAAYSHNTGAITAVGYQAGYNDTNTYSGTDGNVFVGYKAGYNNTLTNAQTFIGNSAGFTKSTTGVLCTYVGASSGYANTIGQGNTAVGYASMGNATSIGESVAIGDRSMHGGTATGFYNVAVGNQSLYLSSSAGQNTGLGFQAGYNNSTQNNNVSVGYVAGYNNTGPTGVFVGAFAGYNILGNGGANSGTNVAIGYQALYGSGTVSNNTAYSNTAIGASTLTSITSGTNQVALGYGCGNNITSGTANICIGSSAVPANATDSYSITMGNNVSGKGSATAYFYPSGGPSYQGNNSATWSVTSDQRLKKNIVDNTVGLEQINGIRIRNFEYRLPEEVDSELKASDAIKKEGVQLGVIAQELQQVLPDCVRTESTGVMSVDSENITWHLINAVKELSAKITALEAKVGV